MDSLSRSSNDDSLLIRAVVASDKAKVLNYVEHQGTAACACFDPKRSTVLLVEQMRPVLGESLLEIPSGRIEKDEPAESAAARETLEETGYAASELKLAASFYSSVGLTDERITIFTTTSFIPPNRGSHGAEFAARWVGLIESIDMIHRGEITDAKTALAIFLISDRMRG